MKKIIRVVIILLLLIAAVPLVSSAATSGYAWGESVGWVDFSKVVVGNDSLSGYARGENIGPISLNCSNTNSCASNPYKVTKSSSGALAGYAWGESVGWINFSKASIDPQTGVFSGYIRGESIGSISLNCSNTNSCGSNSYKISSTLTPPTTPTVQTATVNISASPTSVAYGSASLVTWASTNANATECIVKKNGAVWQNAKSGTVSSGALTANTTFLATCTGPSMTAGTASITVNVSADNTPGAPSNLTASVSATGSRVILNWNASTGTFSDYGVEWKASEMSGWSLFVDGVSKNTTANLTSLGFLPGKTYNIRVYAQNGSIVSNPSNVVNITIPNAAPSVTTYRVTNVTATSAKIYGNVYNAGGGAVTDKGLSYGLNTNYGTTVGGQSEASTTLYYALIGNLVCNTTYHYRAYASNAYGTSYGSDLLFTTAPCTSVNPIGTPARVEEEVSTAPRRGFTASVFNAILRFLGF